MELDPEDPELQAALKEIAACRRHEQPHVPPADLAAFVRGDLPDASLEAVRDHLSVCPACVGLFRELDRATSEPPSRPLAVPPRPQARGFYGIAALAVAVLVAVACGLALMLREVSEKASHLEKQVASLEEELSHSGRVKEDLARDLERSQRELSAARNRLARSTGRESARSRPSVNTPVEQLRATELRGDAERPVTLRLPPEAGVVTLILEDPQDTSFPAYRLELLGKDGRKLAEAGGLERTRYRSFVVTLPREILPEGTLSILLYGVRNGSTREIGRYEIEIVR